MTTTDHPIDPCEADALFAPFTRNAEQICALAVSGGVDSTALMVLFSDWLRRGNGDPGRHTVITIDHGLRKAAASEARRVEGMARALGFGHTTLVWTGPHPQTGIQAAARRARYGLIAAHMLSNGIAAVFTAHTRDDQAETLMMRLARGSGLDGLAAMAPVSRLPGGGEADHRPEGALLVLRPFLNVPKERLAATLRSRGVGWTEDPTNAATEYERARLRAARSELARLGLTNEMLALSAARLRRVRDVLDAAAARFIERSNGNVAMDRVGRVTIDRRKLREAGEEIALRVIGRAIAAAGGSDERPPLSKLEAVTTELIGPPNAKCGAWTLSRAKIYADDRGVAVEREPGRTPLPELALARGTSAVWDGRFVVRASLQLPDENIDVRPLGYAALRRLRLHDPALAASALACATLVPSFWRGNSLLAVPPLQHWSEPRLRDLLRAEFLGLRLWSRDASPC
jgi:tRNA(Ile)-lysidine synthase